MEVRAQQNSVLELQGDAAVIYIFKGQEAPLLTATATGIDERLGEQIHTLIEDGEITGKAGELTVIHTSGKIGIKRIAIAGLGDLQKFTLDKLRSNAAETARALRKLGVKNVCFVIPTAPEETAVHFNPVHAAQAISEGVALGLYTFTRYKSGEKKDERAIERITILHEPVRVQSGDESAHSASTLELLKSAVQRGQIIAEGTNFARDLVNEPPNVLNPVELANRAQQMAQQVNLEIEIIDQARMQELGMGAILAVAQGSRQPPTMTVMRYRGAGDAKPYKLALIGKAVTFDTGGISIKPTEGMGNMKTDMAGGAAVIGAMMAITRLKPQINVLGIVPSSENMPDGNAFRPADIIRAMNGKTIEIITTDAEGRLLLADAMCYAREQGVQHLVDAATLTGACVVALGQVNTGLFANDQDWADQVLDAAERSGELFWQMPMNDEYMDLTVSDVADLRNAGTVRFGGAIIAAKFLSVFADKTAWVHLDIAGTAATDRERGINVKGGTGVGVRSFVALALSMAEG